MTLAAEDRILSFYLNVLFSVYTKNKILRQKDKIRSSPILALQNTIVESDILD